jgi:hypothetical protein
MKTLSLLLQNAGNGSLENLLRRLGNVLPQDQCLSAE